LVRSIPKNGRDIQKNRRVGCISKVTLSLELTFLFLSSLPSFFPEIPDPCAYCKALIVEFGVVVVIDEFGIAGKTKRGEEESSRSSAAQASFIHSKNQRRDRTSLLSYFVSATKGYFSPFDNAFQISKDSDEATSSAQPS
jgi:hypothetical protein